MNCGGSCNQQINFRGISPETQAKTDRHPCYSFGAHHKYARMHLPVAPKCNISCNYCNRKFDCVNESRPGVTSEILSPSMAEQKFLQVREKVENLSVIGIAGPGDALANWEETRKSIEMIKRNDPEVVFCLSTNGLMLPDYAEDIVNLGVNHVTVTLNTLNPSIGARIYKSVVYRGVSYKGIEGAEILLKNQLWGIRYLAEHGVAVKVNIVMINGLNDEHIPQVVKKVKQLGAFIANIMPLIPAKGSVFENYPQTSTKDLNRMRDICQADLQQMRHCQQCRADAIGLLGNDRSREFSFMPAGCKQDSNPLITGKPVKKYRIAVTTKHELMVDEHFGYASEFCIYHGDGLTFQLVERRKVEKYCLGVEQCDEAENRRDKVVTALMDCDAVVSLRIGYHAKKRLADSGINSFETCNTIENALNEVIKILKDKNRVIA